MSNFRILGKRRLTKIMKQHFPEYNSQVAEYAKQEHWERLSCHGHYIYHEIFCGEDVMHYKEPDGTLHKLEFSYEK